MMISVALELPKTPPSLNRMGTRGGWQVEHRTRKAWREEIEWECVRQGLRRVRPADHVTAYCRLRFPERRRRDADNFRALLSKALGDALQNVGLIPDDTPEFYDMAALVFSAEPGAPQTRIFLELLYLNGKEGS